MSDEPDISGTQFIADSPLAVLIRKPQPDAGVAKVPTLLMLHGWGAKESDIYELVPFIDPRVLIVAPRAPGVAGDSERGSFKWYDRVGPQGSVDEALFDESTAKLIELIEKLDEITGLKIDREQLYMGGFSQGGIMSFHLAATIPDQLAGILPHSGFISNRDIEKLQSGAYRGKPAFVAHGEHDMVIQINKAHEAKAILEAGDVALTYREYPIAHATSPQSRQDLAEWLNDRLEF